MMQLRTSNGPTPTAYLNGAQFSDALAGVFFEIRAEGDVLVCTDIHPESADHLLQYAPTERSRFFARAAHTAANDDPPMYTPSGCEAWAA